MPRDDDVKQDGQRQSLLVKVWHGVRAIGAWVNENILPTFQAWMRQGGKEAAQALRAFPDSIQPVEELGMPGNPTQMTVNQEQGNVWGKEAKAESGYDAWLKDQSAVEPEGAGAEFGAVVVFFCFFAPFLGGRAMYYLLLLAAAILEAAAEAQRQQGK